MRAACPVPELQKKVQAGHLEFMEGPPAREVEPECFFGIQPLGDMDIETSGMKMPVGAGVARRPGVNADVGQPPDTAIGRKFSQVDGHGADAAVA